MNKLLLSMGVVLGVLIAGTFIIGAWYSCNSGGGTLTKFKCVNVESIGTCKIDGVDYLVPENYYMEITPEGLNKTILTKNKSGFVSTGIKYEGDLI